ncbi:MAG TPA: hypothetical protein PKC29_05865 [Thermodesulfobacteriota bacterium]|nr:hypothetical protein [Thermodesulfobacteriota bacterium]
MSVRRIIAVLVISLVACQAWHPGDAFAQGGEDVQKELGELKQMMEKMQKRIDDLEEKNRALEAEVESRESKEEVVVKEETVTVPASPSQGAPQGFLSKVVQSLNPEISVVAMITPTWYSLNNPVVFAENDPENTGVNMQEIEVGFQSVVDPYFRFDSFFSFRTEGVELEEAYGTTLFSMPLNSQLKIGRARAKFGRINQIHRHAQNFVTLPIVVAEFLGEHLNPTSVEASFLVPVPWYLELSASGGSPDVETPTFGRSPDANNIGNLLYIFHMANFFDVGESLGVSLGASFATGSNESGPDERSNLYGVDFFAKYRPLKDNPYQEVSLQSEFMWRQAETPEEELEDYGFYAEAMYRFAKRWNTGLRFDFTDTNTPIHEEEDHDHEHEEEEPEEGHVHDETLGLLGRAYRISPMLTFRPSEFSSIRLQYDYLNQNYGPNQHAIFLQFQYAIGAHGAHPF